MKTWLTATVSGVALLALAACGGEDEQATQTPAETTTEQAAESAVEEATEAAEETAEAAAEAVEETAEAASEMASDAADAVAETAEDAAETATQMVDDAAETVTEMADDAAEAATEMVEGATETAGAAGAVVSEVAGEAADSATALVDEAANAVTEAADDAADAAQGVLATAGLAGGLSGSAWASPDSDSAFVAFEAGAISGNSGCNTFAGSYEAGEGGALKVGSLIATQMACAEEIMTAEAAFLAALQSAAAYNIEGDTLILTDGSGNQVVALSRRAVN